MKDKTRVETKYIKKRDFSNNIRRNHFYNDWKTVNRDCFMKPTIFSFFHFRNRSYYNLYIKDRVFDHNMTCGLTNGNFRNYYSELKSKRRYWKISNRKVRISQC